jgi:ABC-2 type transport system permease protein
MQIIYWRKKTTDVPKIFQKNSLSRPLIYGLTGGLIAGLVGILYLRFIMSHSFFSEVNSQASVDSKTQWWLFGLAVCAAPLFEEFIFRGIIFKGLARTWSLPIAMIASAAIFAIVHPPISVAPVFFLALVTSFIYSRTNLLIAPMVAHAVYNFIILEYQMNLLNWMK